MTQLNAACERRPDRRPKSSAFNQQEETMADDINDIDTPTEADLKRIYGSKYLTANDVGDRKIRARIKKIRKEDLRNSDGTKQAKFVLYDDLDKPFALNATNVETLVEALGSVPEKWLGANIVVYVDRNVTYGGKRGGLRLRVLAPAATKPEPSSPNDAGPNDMDEDIPF
jgi:hypothetical protein